MKLLRSLVLLPLSLLLGFLLLSFVLKKYSWSAVVDGMRSVTLGYLILFLLISVLIMVAFVLRWWVILRAQGHSGLRFSELFGYRTIDYGVTYITPTGKLAGEPVRAAMLIRNGIGFKQGITTITIDKTIEMSFNALLFVIGCFLLILYKALSGGLAVFIALLCAFLIFLNWLFFYRILKGRPIFLPLFRFFHLDAVGRLRKIQSAIVELERPIVTFYKEKRTSYFIALALTIAAFLLSMIEYYLLLRMLGLHPSAGQTFLVFSAVGLSFMLPVPMGLGTLEAVQVWMFTILGFGSAAGVGLALLTRGRDLLWVILAIMLAVYYGSLKRVLSEAFNSRYSNPVVSMTVFRAGKPFRVNLRVLRYKDYAAFKPQVLVRNSVYLVKGEFERLLYNVGLSKRKKPIRFRVQKQK